MAKSTVIVGGSLAVTGATNRYHSANQCRLISTYFATTSVDFPWPVNATFSNLRFNIIANDRASISSGTLNVTLYVNGTITALTQTFSAGATGQFADDVNTVSVTAGDVVSLRISNASGGSGGFTVNNISYVVDSTAAGVVHGNYYNNSIGTLFNPFIQSSSGIESSQQQYGIAGTISQFRTRIGSNTRNGDLVSVLRINGANGASTTTATAATPSVTYTDTSNTDTIADGDLICISFTRGGTTGVVTLTEQTVYYEGDNNSYMSFTGTTLALSPGSATDYFFNISGITLNGTATEAENSIVWAIDDQEASYLSVRISTNTIATDSDYVFRKNGSDTALTVTILASTTGRFYNTTDTVAIDDGDIVGIKLAAGGSGNISFFNGAIKFGPVAAGGATNVGYYGGGYW